MRVRNCDKTKTDLLITLNEKGENLLVPVHWYRNKRNNKKVMVCRKKGAKPLSYDEYIALHEHLWGEFVKTWVYEKPENGDK